MFSVSIPIGSRRARAASGGSAAFSIRVFGHYSESSNRAMSLSGVRAVRAAKDTSESIGGLGRLLNDAANFDVSGSNMDYILHTLVFLLKTVCGELRASTIENPSASIAVSLLERCNAPESILADLQSWMRDGSSDKKRGIVPQASADVADRSSLLKPSVPPASKTSKDSPKKSAGIMLRKSQSGEPEPESGTSKAPKIVMWKASEEKEETSEDSDKEATNDDDDFVNNDRLVLRKLRGSTAAGVVGGTGAYSNIADRRRRFTVNISSVNLPIPPEDEVIENLRMCSVFKNVSDADMRRVAAKVKCQRFERDESVITFGAPSEALHIVWNGTGAVSVPHKVGHLKKGDVFGDGALRQASATNLTQVSATGGPMTTISLTAADWQALSLKSTGYERSNKSKVARVFRGGREGRDGIEADGCSVTGFPLIGDYRLTATDRQMIKEAVRANKVLGEVLELSERQFDMIADAVHLISVARDEVVMRIGDQGAVLYIVQEGLLEVKTKLNGNMQGEFKLRAGDSFGELGLLYDAPRTATITASSLCKMWVLSRDEFEVVIRASHTHRIAEYSDLLVKIPCLRSACGENHIDMIAGVVEEISFLEGDSVCVEGEDNGLLFLIYAGECNMMKDGRLAGTLGRGDWIGEAQLMSDIAADVSVKVQTEAAVVLVLDMNGLNTVINAVEELRSPGMETAQSASRCSLRGSIVQGMVADNPYFDHVEKTKATDKVFQQRVQKAFKRQGTKFFRSLGDEDEDVTGKPNLFQLEEVGALGEGTFGLVYLFQTRDRSGQYALKAVSKEHILRENLGNMMQSERNILFLLDSRFIVHLFNAYQDENYVYLLLEAALGGELFDIYTDADMWGKLPNAKYYFASVALGLQALHMKRVIYRDLKLENCLLDAKGHLKLTDMGVAKVVIGKTYTVCGTADYFAPETLRQSGHNRAVDWWASGVLLFIMVAGRSPFDAPEVPMIYKNIIRGFSKVRFPKCFPSDLIDLIKSLCRKQPEERVTMQKGGIHNLMEMPFFSSFSWDDLGEGKMVAPYIPPEVNLEAIKSRKLTREWHLDRESMQEWDGAVGISRGPEQS